MIGGINDDNMTKLCSDIQTYAEKIQELLNQSYDELENVNFCLKGTGSFEYNNKIADLKMSIKNIVNNLKTYVDDYNQVVQNYISNDQDIAKQTKRELLEKEGRYNAND